MGAGQWAPNLRTHVTGGHTAPGQPGLQEMLSVDCTPGWGFASPRTCSQVSLDSPLWARAPSIRHPPANLQEACGMCLAFHTILHQPSPFPASALGSLWFRLKG